MREVAPGIFRPRQFPRPLFNVYLGEGILFDAASTWDRRRLTRELRDHEITMVALTHAHPDHQGLASEFCQARDVPLACHADDVDAMEGRRPVGEEMKVNWITKKVQDWWTGPPHPVSRVLEDGDTIGSFTAHHMPGHSRGQVAYFRESDRVAICGDVMRNMSFLTMRTMLAEPPEMFTYDPAENRRSIRKLAALEPKMILPGHGPPVTDMNRFHAWVDSLPD